MSECGRSGRPAASSIAWPPAIHQDVPANSSATSDGVSGSHGSSVRRIRAGYCAPRERRLMIHSTETTTGVQSMATMTTRDGQLVSYVDHGGDGPAVVLLHSFLMDVTMWAPQVAAFGQ